MNLSISMQQIFFFQAEDGIRDWSVTGVQTCALPIFSVLPARRDRPEPRRGQCGEGRPHDPAEQQRRAVRANLPAQGQPEGGRPLDRRHDDARVGLRGHHAGEPGGHRGREAREALRGGDGMSENYQTVLNHLLFHKALISETEGGQRINRYLAMLNEIDQGMHVAVRDPFEKSVVAAFKLVLERQMDPWEINLTPFTKLFLEKVKKEGTVNFVTAGKLVFLAWSILKLQSDKVLLNAMPPEAPPDDGAWDLDMFRDPADLDYNQVVLDGTATPLTEAIRREGRRAVTLMELMDAFDEARRE